MFVVWDGDVTPEEWSDQFERILPDPVFPPEQLVLADLSTAGGAPRITTDVIDEMGSLLGDAYRGTRQDAVGIIPDGAWDNTRRFGATSTDRTVDASLLTQTMHST
jgi:hypothetical protein